MPQPEVLVRNSLNLKTVDYELDRHVESYFDKERQNDDEFGKTLKKTPEKTPRRSLRNANTVKLMSTEIQTS